MGERNGKFIGGNMDWKLEFARLQIIATFARWFWCQDRLNELVNSYDSNSSREWLAMFAELRRVARNAQFAWVAALYEFKRLVEVKAKDSGHAEN